MILMYCLFVLSVIHISFSWKPIQSFWLYAIYDQIIEQRSDPYFSTSWWILGSLYRGTKMIGSNYAHINGNALYQLSSN